MLSRSIAVAAVCSAHCPITSVTALSLKQAPGVMPGLRHYVAVSVAVSVKTVSVLPFRTPLPGRVARHIARQAQ